MSTDQKPQIEIYDTTLRDGSQLEGISLTVEDKLRIAEQLDWLGVHYIEAGWPGANPKDDELFRRVPTELKLDTSILVAFGSTRRVKGKVDSDDTLRHLVEANVGTVCIVGKSWDYHVTEALGTTLDEGVAMVGDSVEFLRRSGMQVLFDAEHFFDGFKRNPEFALRVLEAAATKRPEAYEHVSPEIVGNGTRFVVSELAGKSTLGLKAKELGLQLDGPQLADVVETLKRLEHEGYHFEVADGSLELLMRRATGWEPNWFRVESFRGITDDVLGVDTLTDKTGATVMTEATVKIHIAGRRVVATAEGNGPVNALDC